MKSHKKYKNYSKYVKINSANTLYFTLHKMNRYFEEINENKYLTIDPTDEKAKEKEKKYEELWVKIRDLIRSVAKNL